VIQQTEGKLHWNYFLALERDMETVSRYIEFSESNYAVYSIELAHLLFAAASEADVVCKLLCEQIDPVSRRDNIIDYRTIIRRGLPGVMNENVYIRRYGLAFTPWVNWTLQPDTNPDWWRAYNGVKHERNVHFQDATLKNALNALGALLVVTFHYYLKSIAQKPLAVYPEQDLTAQLQPESSLLRLKDGYYSIPFHVRG